MFILHSFYGYKYSNLWCICSFNWLLIECFSSQWHTYNLSCSVIITGCGILCWSGRLKFHESIPTLMVFNPTDYSEKLHCLTLKNSAFYLSNRRISIKITQLIQIIFIVLVDSVLLLFYYDCYQSHFFESPSVRQTNSAKLS